RVHTGVIGKRLVPGFGKHGGELLGAAARAAIDDAVSVAMRGNKIDDLAPRVRFRPHRKPKVGPIERPDEGSRLRVEQLLADVRSRWNIRRGCQRDGLDATEIRADFSQRQIFWPEIVPPLRHAMSL